MSLHIKLLGHMVVYGFAGILADRIAQIRNMDESRGFVWVVIASGVMLFLASVIVPLLRSVKNLERKD